MKAVNPATGQTVQEYATLSEAEVRARLDLASSAFRSWRTTSFSERAERLLAAAAELEERQAEHAALITSEMGKPIAEAEAEVAKCAWVCRYYAEEAEGLLAPRAVSTDASESFVRYDPLGPVLAVMPWNFPYWQVFRFAAPALMAGNVGLLKHASNVPGSALEIAAVFERAGVPEGVFQTLLVPSSSVAAIIADPAVAAVTLTGSELAGREVAARAGEALKKTVLELGGSDPFIVLADADLEAAAEGAVTGRALNSGQSCIAAKRFLVEDQVHDAFVEAFTDKLGALPVGDPMERATRVGPLARPDLVETLEHQVERTLAAGARAALGGGRRPGAGCFFEPTILVGVEPGMAAFDEETFGPVAAVTRVRGAEHAVELANASDYGLGASLWTGDRERSLELAARIEAGSVFINGIVKSDPRLPFGGIKLSGYGRELAGEGIREFVNIKTVWRA